MASLSIENIQAILRRKLNKNFDILSYEQADSVGVPIGFLSVQEKVCITYRSEGVVKKLHLFIKMLPESNYYRNVVKSTGAFTKEAMFFELFLNDLKDKYKGNPVPMCYLAQPDGPVILEDLSQKGFTNVPLLETLSVEHCEKVIESLAKIHAFSLLLEIKNGCKLNNLIPILDKETIFSTDKNNRATKAVSVGFETLKKIKHKYLPHYSQELTNQVFEYMDNLIDKLVPSTKYPNVFTHNDLWANNIMFRYDENSKVCEACIIDFQLASYKPITFDLQMFIHACTNKQLREKHYKHLLKYYYEQLTKQLSMEDINSTNILPWSMFENALNETFPILLGAAPLFLHFVLMPDEIVRDVLRDDEKWKYYYEEDRSEFVFKAIDTYPAYKQRLMEAFTDLFEYFKNSE